ncbi:hypothetical protein Tsubulata_047167, partial [Turnera subulata]
MKGIAVNLQATVAEDGSFAGESGSKFMDLLIARGFKPTGVHELWNCHGHSGCAVVDFSKDWSGFADALSFEYAYKEDSHGKEEWFSKSEEKSGVYCWVARADDYNLGDVIGEHLRNIGDLIKISDKVEAQIYDGSNALLVAEIMDLRRELAEQKEENDELINLLFQKERISSMELQDAHKELVLGFSEMSGRYGDIGVKRMGELDTRPFFEAMKIKYGEQDAEDRAFEICSLWKEYLRDPGQLQEVVDDEDTKLKKLKKDVGEGAYNAVAKALVEMNEYNPSGRFLVNNDDFVVWPVKGIAVNLQTMAAEDGSFVGESGSKFRDVLIARGFNPTGVHVFGDSGCAVVDFTKDWSGFADALSFEYACKEDNHGKKEWFAELGEKSGIYCWIARADDYTSDNVVGEHLRKIGDLKKISDKVIEERQRKEKLIKYFEL